MEIFKEGRTYRAKKAFVTHIEPFEGAELEEHHCLVRSQFKVVDGEIQVYNEGGFTHFGKLRLAGRADYVALFRLTEPLFSKQENINLANLRNSVWASVSQALLVRSAIISPRDMAERASKFADAAVELEKERIAYDNLSGLSKLMGV